MESKKTHKLKHDLQIEGGHQIGKGADGFFFGSLSPEPNTTARLNFKTGYVSIVMPSADEKFINEYFEKL
jgi:hypothetical protein